ncbi:hypothetical protein BAQ46_18520 [Bacillus paranthracis]|uniref:P-loop NTPase fold protein n=1 Tax=Bacillus paranthracis TaxID=2026186 RepID=UPI0008FE816D|nr:P-loop NTPase fold protein [Bacillus paranthracis]OJE21345.1 hypothetical protein BAQ46_18520 [Bacillus paranthracis]
MQTPSGESMQYIIDSILDYIKRDKTSYAILLNGKWGSGKTYFWENVLKEKIEKKTIYVSLYGINSTEEISKRIALGRWGNVQKLNESKWGGRMTELAKATFGILKSVEIPFVKEMPLPKIDFDQFFDYTNTVLCFDDLERANIDVNEILGYINNFVEHDGIKVILIANENEIEAKLNDKNAELKMLTTCFYTDMKGEFDQKSASDSEPKQIPINDLITRNLKDLFQKKNEYKRIKEKLIGKTLTLQLDEKVLIENIVVQTSNEKQDLQKFLEDNLTIIEDTYRESNSKNIRVLKQALEDFELIYQHCKEDGYEINMMLQSILKFVLAASFAIKTNMPNNEELEEIISHDDFITSMGLSGILGTKGKKFIEQFRWKYYNGQSTSYQRKFFKFAEVLIRKGIFNKELFNEEMDSFKLELEGIKSKDPHEDFIKGSFWNLSDNEFWQSEKTTYNKLVNGELHFALYFSAYKMYDYFTREKIISKNIMDIKQELMEGLKKAAENGEYTEFNYFMFYVEEDRDDIHLAEFKDKIIEINNGLKVKKEKIQVQLLLELMRTDFHKFFMKMKEYYLYNPFFAYCDPEEMYANIIDLSAEDINTVRFLIEQRMKLVDDNHNSNLQMELPNLRIIKCRLNDEISSREMTPRLVLLMKLVDEIKGFENKVNRINSISQST